MTGRKPTDTANELCSQETTHTTESTDNTELNLTKYTTAVATSSTKPDDFG